MLLLVFILMLIAVGVATFFQQKKFGRKPAGQRKDRINRSPNFKNGSFQNITESPVLLPGSFSKMVRQLFSKPASTKPPLPLPSVQFDFKNDPLKNPVVIWFGHSSYLILLNGYRILIDPVIQGNASPVSFFGKPFAGSDVYSLNDLPPIDLVVITHDHYDHLHYESIRQLASTTGQFCTSLGVGSHLEHWGVPPEKITELDWHETTIYRDDIVLTAAPARHFSGRTFKRGQTLWSAFILQWHGYRLFLGGDSGYGSHFKEIGERSGPFDLAILECGQYGNNWPYIHMMPEQTVQAAQDLRAKVLLPVHWAKFELSAHPWNEPIIRVTKKASESGLFVTTPQLGEAVIIDSVYPRKIWWSEITLR